MRLVTYEHEGRWRPGILVEQRIADATRCALEAGILAPGDARWASSRAVLALDDEQRQALAAAAAASVAAAGSAIVEPAAKRGPPIADPEKIICVGLNYRDHAQEIGAAMPAAPVLFAKYRNALAGHERPIRIPRIAKAVDYEGELAIVIGRRCAQVPAAEALSVVGGAMAFNDISARDLQFQTSQWLAGKAIDGFAPCGPELVLADELDDLQRLDLTTRVNGHTMQDSNTAEMIFTIAETIAFVSSLMTLEVGDIIATGTPAGVGHGRTPRVELRPGDVVEVEIEGIGTLRNPIIAGA